ncbi:MAG: hypothetical protein KF894_00210 [Labilithrix sp.]|nr:hypothetical protein [Labilithrix sp.]
MTTKEADVVRGRSWLFATAEILTVGFPFCSFKVLTGIVLVGLPSLRALGWALVALGAVDVVLNALNLASLVLLRRRVSGVCLVDVLARRLDRRRPRGDLGVSLDVLLSFGLVALVIGAGLIARLPSWALPLWNVSVVLNVLGAGIGRVLAALHARRDDRAPAPASGARSTR